MSTAEFLAEVRTRFPNWGEILLALRQDALVWEALQETDLGLIGLDVLPTQGAQWTPAALSLLAVNYPLSLEELRAVPLQPLNPVWQRKSVQAYKNWIRLHKAPETLALAGLLALVLRERFRLEQRWDALLADSGVLSDDGRTILACLYGMIPAPQELLFALLKPVDGPSRPDLVAHALLSNPMDYETYIEILEKLVHSCVPERRVEFIEELATQRPWLAADLAKNILDGVVAGDESQLDQRPDSEHKVADGIARLTGLVHKAKGYQLAGQPEEAVPLLAEALRAMRWLRGHLSAQMAQVVSVANDASAGDHEWGIAAQGTGLAAWKRAVQLAPDEPLYSVGLVAAMVSAGHLDEACEHLQRLKTEGTDVQHASVLLATALVAVQLGEEAEAREAALGALELVETGQAFDRVEYVTLARIFQLAGMWSEVQRTASRGLQRYPTCQELLACQAQAYHSLEKPISVIANAYAALAVEQASPGRAGLEHPAKSAARLPGLSEPAGESDEHNDPGVIGPREIQSLLAENLEIVGAWKAALKERLGLFESIDSPSILDQFALAECALKAGEPKIALRTCTNILEIEAENLLAHRLLAEAAQASGEYQTAIEHFQRVTHLNPEAAEAWVGLARTYELVGRDEQALEALRAASQAAPHEAEIHLALGEMYLQRSEPTQALACFRQAAELSPSILVSLRLGQTLFQLGHLDEARQTLEAAYQDLNGEVDRDEDTTSYENREIPKTELVYAYARTLLGLGESPTAVPLLKEVICAEPGNPEPYLDLAKALMGTGNQREGAQRALPLLGCVMGSTSSEALECPLDSSQVIPKFQAEAQALLAEAYAILGDLERSMDAYRGALEHSADLGPARRPRLALGLGQVALRLDQPETAVAALQDALQAEPLNADVQQALSEAYLASGLASDAYQAAKTALDLRSSDLKVLAWFAEQGELLLGQPATSQFAIQAEVIEALQKATQLAPGRADLLLKLARMYLETGDREAALETFRELVSVEAESQGIPVEDLYRAAQTLREVGEAQLAISLLQRAIERLSADSPLEERDVATIPGYITPQGEVISLADLYAEISLSYQLAEDLDAALGSLDLAIEVDPHQAALFCQKADLLQAQGSYAQALDCLERAAGLTPDDLELNYRQALIARSLGDLPAAFSYAENALVNLVDSNDVDLDSSFYVLAAELAYRTLRPEKAREYLASDDLEVGSNFNDYKHASLQAELALDIGDEATASQAVMVMREMAGGHPRCLAAQARLACLRGENAQATDFLGSAFQGLDAVVAERAGEADVMDRLAVAQAALDAALWEEALTTIHDLLDQAPDEPLAHLKLAQALVLRAEAQRLFQTLDVIAHAPGEQTLGEGAYRSFEQAVKGAMRGIEWFDERPEINPLDWLEGEAGRNLGLWYARGRAVFQPEKVSARILWNVLKAVSPGPRDLAALIMAIRQIGDFRQAVKVAQPDWHPAFASGSPVGHPLVLAQLALTLDEAGLEGALETAKQALDRASVLVSGGWPEVSMLQFLLARLAYQRGEIGLSLEAIQKALAVWPEEARWHFLAAQIYQAEDAAAGLPNQSLALGCLAQAALLEPNQPLHLLELGRAFLEEGQFQMAFENLEGASHLDPKNREVWIALARAQRALGKLDQGAFSAERAIELMENPTEAVMLRGEIALENKNPRQALVQAQRVLRDQPDYAEGIYLMARALGDLGRYTEALLALETAMPLFENSFGVQLERVQMLRRAQGLEDGLVALQELTYNYGARPELLALLAEWLQESGDYESALHAARLALQEQNGELSPGQLAALHYQVGLNMRQAGQLDQAIHHLSEAVGSAPDQLDIYLELGQAYQERREYKRALLIFQKAIDMTDGDYRPYYYAGKVFKDNKDYMAAETMLRRAAQIAPNEVSIHRLLGAVVALNLVHSRTMAASGVR